VDISILQDLECFSLGRDDSLKSIASFARITTYPRGDILFYENDSSDMLYYLLSGRVKIYKVDRYDNEVFLYSLNQGGFITELSSFDMVSCFSNAEFMEDSRVLKMKFEKLRDIALKDSGIFEGLFNSITKRVKLLECIINREVLFDGSAKVAHLIDTDIELFNTSKKQEIAHMLNIQPETLSRILKKLSRDELITNEDGKIVVLNKEGLQEIYR
jgi:CRP/FNR family transcriptional regulator